MFISSKNKIKKKSQGAIEFMIIFSAMLFFFILFFAIIQDNIADKNREKMNILAQNIAMDVQDEVNLAYEASEGYFREFSIPQNILGREYNIIVSESRVYLTMEGFSVSYSSHEVTGTIIKGDNFIRKENGVVYVNQ